MPVIEIHDFRYEKINSQGMFRLAIDHLVLDGPGLIAIKGESGSGKSTLLGFLSGEDQSDYQGSLKVLGQEWRNLVKGPDIEKQWHLRNVGYVSQKLGLVPDWTVRKTLEQALDDADVPRDEWEARIGRVLNQLGIARYLNSPVDEISGGEQQRVSIARVLARRPPIIIADEPTSRLDAANADLVMDLLRELGASALVVVVTHTDAIADQCDRKIEFTWGTKIPHSRKTVIRRIRSIARLLAVVLASLAFAGWFWQFTERRATNGHETGIVHTVEVPGNVGGPTLTSQGEATYAPGAKIAMTGADVTATVGPTATVIAAPVATETVEFQSSVPHTALPVSEPSELPQPAGSEPTATIELAAVATATAMPTQRPTELDKETARKAAWPTDRDDSTPGLYAWLGVASVSPGSDIPGLPDWVACDDARDYCLLGYDGKEHVLVQTDGFEVVGTIPDSYSDPKGGLLILGMTEEVADQILGT